MKVDGQHFRSIWFDHDRGVTEIIDQRWLPHRFETQPLNTLDDFADSNWQMRVRGAPLIGVTAADGVA